jgi:hypothetical protein
LMDTAHQFKGCHLTHQTMIQSAFHDVVMLTTS